MKKKLYKTLCLCFLSIVACLLFYRPALAEVRDISLENGEKLYDTTHSSYYDREEDGYINESDLFLVGDSGKIIPCTNWPGQTTITVEYVSSDASVVQIDSEGNYQALKEGIATVTVKGLIKSVPNEEFPDDDEEEDDYYATCLFQVGGDVSRTTLKNTEMQSYVIDQGYGNGEIDDIVIPFLNAPDLQYCSFQVISPEGADNSYSSISCRLDKSQKTLVVSMDYYEKSTIDVEVRLNKKTFTLTIKVSRVQMKKNSALLPYRGKISLKVKGYPGKLKWVSTNKKVATVSKTGYVKAKGKTGNALIYAQIGNHRLGCAVSVISPKMKKVISRAKRIAKTCKYSQAKRMSDKYYDCSSLVWKSYRRIGKTFGNAHYAPVAADIAKWCAQRKGIVKGGTSNNNITKMKLRPGDLVFKTGENNGRYKGIYHVEMFVGYSCYGFNGNKPILETCWANRGEGYGGGGYFVCRP